ncbi:protocatechuate 3,4-dioxygenase [Halomonas sp. McH1-25]|uniref:class III extradiol dioxygenase family protein n=1 Tax=unclassified Halomonas TaxID=2609666 RepID=UPI001EF3E49C|nr:MULTISPECIES: class III extradiol dioxygenase family protein [unclassified Halomonas]MCG7601289.1 protocatechuate 3,4-dioxygenase [Halomonas sp. McH1-25]MCP1343260.1 class III extradiol dioxygenase family protein [Halomonas sp. FL8]MCP1360749.1 class III extradiol dioxygenase family protein [Halomonas sp. BBD45]
MASIVAGIGSSHVPSIGRAYDQKKQQDPAWQPLFDGYEPVKRWLAEEVKADVVILVYNDHGTEFFLDRYPTFALGVADSYKVADEGYGRRPLPDFPGDAAFSEHLANHLVADEFDLTLCQEMALDHGFLTAMPLLWTHDEEQWPVKVVPLLVNVIQHPLPSGKRCYKLGEAIRRAVEAYPEDLRVVVVGTGGLSHQLNGERFGHINEEWDRQWLQRIQTEPQALASLSHKEVMTAAGAEGGEVIMWFVMRGAMTERVNEVHRFYYAPMTTGIGLLALENAGDTSP